MPYIKYQDWRPTGATGEVVAQANELIELYREQGLVLTLRQLYYQFVARDLLENTIQNYKRLGSIVNNARLAGLLDWGAIEDRGRELIEEPHWDTPADIVRVVARQFAVDKWGGQEYRVEVWVEKQALEAVVGQAAEPLDCPYFACKGYVSQSAMWEAAQRFEGYHRDGQLPVIIHLGDHDPSGIDMTRDIFERINDVFSVEVEVRRIALNMDQVEEYSPPPNPAKMTDSRATGYVDQFGMSSWELDALEPIVLRDLITETINEYRDVDKYEAKKAEEERGRELLGEVSDRWEEIAEMVS